MSDIKIGRLGPDSAPELAALIAAYAQEVHRGAPRRPDEYYATRILEDEGAQLLGAWVEGKLIGFAMYFDLVETISGLRCGQIDDFYVYPDYRTLKVARRLIETLVTEGESRGWAHLRWRISVKNEAALELYSDIGEPAPWKSYVIRIDKLAPL